MNGYYKYIIIAFIIDGVPYLAFNPKGHDVVVNEQLQVVVRCRFYISCKVRSDYIKQYESKQYSWNLGNYIARLARASAKP